MKQKNQKRKGMKFEKRCQKTISSGAVWFDPLDLKYENYCIEAKYTDKKGYRITTKLLDEIWGKSLEMNKEPFLIIGIKRNDNQIFTLHCSVNMESK